MLQGLPIVDVSELTHYRIKICVNFNNQVYTDTITDKFLLSKIECFCKTLKNEKVLYGYFQKSNYNNHYSIVLVCSPDIEIVYLEEIYHNILDDDLYVFGYQFKDQHNNITYLSKETKLDYNYYGFIWHVSPSSFIQVNLKASEYIHHLVQELICKDANHFCGLGGEMGIYAKAFSKNFTCLTNSRDIYEDCILNLGNDNVNIVDYDMVNLNDYMHYQDQILVINISRNGLRNLAEQIVKINFKQIIYIGCCDKAVSRDLDILLKRYSIDKIYKINQFPETQYYSYVIALTLRKN